MGRRSLPAIVKFIVSIVICQLAGFIGSLFTTPSIPSWYATLTKPSFTPPNWVFAPVWTTLYLLMGISLFLVWRKSASFRNVKPAIYSFAVQLILNIFWSILFFGLKSPLVAFVEIIFLWAAIIMTSLRFYRVSKLSCILLMPYLLWVSFAAVLNFSLWQLNV